MPSPFHADSHAHAPTVLVAALSSLLCGGCLSLSPDEIRTLERVGQAGYSLERPPDGFVPAASDRKAACLNALPGIGNFYLAANGGGGLQWVLGTGNLLLWPISPAWSICEGYADAKTINKRALAAYCDKYPNLCINPAIPAEQQQQKPPTQEKVESEPPPPPPPVKPHYRIEEWKYDSVSRKGQVRIRAIDGMPTSEAKQWARENISAIVSEKNIVIEAGKVPPEGAKFRSLDESFANGILTVEFEAIE